MKYKRKFLIFITFVLVCITALMISNMSYSYLTKDLENSVTYKTVGKAKTDELSISFNENREGIDLIGNYSLDGLYKYEAEPYTYIVANDEVDKYITISIILEVTKLSTLSDEDINIEIDQNVKRLDECSTTSTSEDKFKSAYLIDKFNLSPLQSVTRTLKVSLDGLGFLEEGHTWSARILVVPSLNEDPAVKVLDKMNLIPNVGSLDNPNFSNIATGDEGVYSIEDDYGTSYYYRGAVVNNYVYFAGHYYRVIRINGNGTLRVIYDGTMPHPNGEASSDRVVAETTWNESPYFDDVKYTGYKFGGMNADASVSEFQAQSNNSSSTIKKILEEWYKINIVDTGFGGYIDDSTFCNDRYVTKNELTNESALGYAKNVVEFGFSSRVQSEVTSDGNIQTSIHPSLKCTNKNDAFTVSDDRHGNKTLEYPVGLLSADEVSIAGGSLSGPNVNYYLYKGIPFWTMSPAKFDGFSSYEYIISQDGQLSTSMVSSMGIYVSPVINLSKEFVENMTGSGTMEDPYTL